MDSVRSGPNLTTLTSNICCASLTPTLMHTVQLHEKTAHSLIQYHSRTSVGSLYQVECVGDQLFLLTQLCWFYSPC